MGRSHNQPLDVGRAGRGPALSPQAADLIRPIARVFLDEPADLMAEVHAAVTAAADEPLRSERRAATRLHRYCTGELPPGKGS
jgi:hypothetical protein